MKESEGRRFELIIHMACPMPSRTAVLRYASAVLALSSRTLNLVSACDSPYTDCIFRFLRLLRKSFRARRYATGSTLAVGMQVNL